MSSHASRTVRRAAIAGALALGGAAPGTPLAAQDDTAVTQAGDAEAQSGAEEGGELAPPEPESRAIDILITVPRGEVNEAQAQECVERADAGTISGEIVVCRRLGEDPANFFSGGSEAAQRRYAQETAFRDDPRTPNTFGIPDHGNGIRIGSAPEAALLIDVEALPDAPPGSDADRIARGLPPLGENDELSEEEIRKRREALGLPPPRFERRPK